MTEDFVRHGRDLRLDFMRGLVMLVVICVHLEYLSIFSLFMWERLGLFSSAEGFVLLSGVVLGIVYKKKVSKDGFKVAAIKLWRRAFQLYTVNVAVIVSVLLLQLIPWLNVFELTHWVSVVAGGPTFDLFEVANNSWTEIIRKTLLLEIGPHQFQVIGLYTVLIALAPGVLLALHKHKTIWVLLLSWSIYCVNIWLGLRLSGAKFEYAFPTMSWQLLFFNGMVIGFHHHRVFGYLSSVSTKWPVVVSGVLLFGFMVLALNNPSPSFWPWHSAIYADEVSYRLMYDHWFSKERLGIGRILNNVALYITLFVVITRNWMAFYNVLGWLVIPIGQASLYVFIWHIYFVLLFSNTPLPALDNIWINSGIHLFSVLLIWTMVKKRFLFAIVPR